MRLLIKMAPSRSGRFQKPTALPFWEEPLELRSWQDAVRWNLVAGYGFGGFLGGRGRFDAVATAVRMSIAIGSGGAVSGSRRNVDWLAGTSEIGWGGFGYV